MSENNDINLINFVKGVDRAKYNEWYKNWVEEVQLERNIKTAAEQGYTAFSIQPKLQSMTPYDYDPYELMLFEDPRTVKRIEKRLGNGFQVGYYQGEVPRKWLIFNLEPYQKYFIFITWERDKE